MYMKYEHLKLSNQICFPVYAASRLITREYQPYLEEMGITYPQYLALLVLWETDAISVNTIAKKLILNTNTVTPLLKRMESQGIISRIRSGNDERRVIIRLTDKGKSLRIKAATLPEKLVSALKAAKMTTQELIQLRDKINNLVDSLNEKDKPE